MKIIGDFPNYIHKEISRLIEEGKYHSISNFLLVAAENQLTLESDDATGLFTSNNDDAQRMTYSQEWEYNHPSSIIPSVEPFDNRLSDNYWENWIWGQINRLLPIKFAARLLAIETAKIGKFPKKEDFDSVASNAARNYGNYLKEQDVRLEKDRDEKLSTGFPVSPKKDKSMDRFISHFIGYQRSDGSLTGGLFNLGFANVIENLNGELTIGLTDSGIAFSKIENPVLDKNDFKKSLGDDECKFYLQHILKYVPGEVSLFSVLLKLINNGVTKREPINQEIRKIVSISDWSAGLVSTQRSGAISRMYEIGLITKKRIGLEVQYLSTDLGDLFLRNTK